MKGAARQRGPFQHHRRAVFSRRGQTGIYPPACPESSGTQTNNHRRNTGISKRAAWQLLADFSKKPPRTLAQCGRGGKAEKPLGLKKNNYGVSIKSLYQ